MDDQIARQYNIISENFLLLNDPEFNGFDPCRILYRFNIDDAETRIAILKGDSGHLPERVRWESDPDVPRSTDGLPDLSEDDQHQQFPDSPSSSE